MVSKEPPPISRYGGIRTDEKRQNSSILIYGNTTRESRIWTNCLASPDLEQLLTKTKKELWQAPITSLLGLLCFASFCLAILNTKDQALGTQNRPPPFRLFDQPLTIVRRPSLCTSRLSTLNACDVCLGLVGLVACGERWPMFGRHNFVTFVMQVVLRD